MRVDDIIIGSGLSALAVALGLKPGRRILVLGGAGAGAVQTYPARRTPAAYSGRGGLGNFWHGIIPLGSDDAPVDAQAELLERFYPGALKFERLGSHRFLVPWRPIRPQRLWLKLGAERPTLQILDASADSIEPQADRVQVTSASGIHEAGRVWMAAGPLRTPGILARSLGWPIERTVSDHLIGYLGRTPRSATTAEFARRIRRDRHGVWVPSWRNSAGTAVYTLRPAWFDFRKLDQGIQLRDDFGLPTSRAAAAIAGRLSPGLVMETLFNKAGLFASAGVYSAYLQARVADAYRLTADGELADRNDAAFAEASQAGRRAQPFADLEPSRLPGLAQPGIHLHGSLTSSEIISLRNDRGLARVSVVDSSAWPDIGPEHHTFRMMARAFAFARDAS